MTSRQQKLAFQHEIPGTISLISKENTLNNPSLVQDVWEFEHDPDDRFLLDAFNRQTQTAKKYNHYDEKKGEQRHRKLRRKNQNQNAQHSSEVTIELEKRNEYGLRKKKAIMQKKIKNLKQKQNSEKNIKHIDIKTNLHSVKEYQSHKIHDSPKISNGKNSFLQEPQTVNRDIDILQRKNISNMNFLMSQIKQLLNLNKIFYLEVEREETRKALMKLQIQCRKLKISLRSSASSSRLNELKKRDDTNQSGKKKKSLLNSLRTHQSIKEEELCENIAKQKKKMHELSTKESILNNYYTVVKTKPTPTELKSEKLRKIKKPSIIVMNEEERNIHYKLLKSKKDVLLASVSQAEKHLKKKISQIASQKRLMKDELQIIENKIKKIDELQFKHQVGSPTLSRLNSQKKSVLNHFQPSKSKKKLNFKANSQECLNLCGKNYNLEKVKSHKEFLWPKNKVEKNEGNKYENQYFTNTKYYKYK